MTLSVRLDRETERLILRLAKARGVSRSEVVRGAILRLRDEATQSLEGPSFFDRVSDLVGAADGLGEDLSERTGDSFRRRLRRRR